MKILFAMMLLLIVNMTQANEMLTELELKWGQTQQELINKSFDLTACSTRESITSCEVFHSIEGNAFGALYVLFFDKNSGLQKLQMPVRYIENDNEGIEGKTYYKKLKAHLNKPYGEPKSYQYSGKAVYVKPEQFYQCLQQENCRSWSTFWHLKNGDFTYISLTRIGQDIWFF